MLCSSKLLLPNNYKCIGGWGCCVSVKTVVPLHTIMLNIHVNCVCDATVHSVELQE